MGSQVVTGKCHLCGGFGKLSFEHSPPKKAFNDDSVLYVEMATLLAGGDIDVLTGKIHQRGVGSYTLCDSCNNWTGSCYGGAFVDLAKQGMVYLQSVRSAGEFQLPFGSDPFA